MKRVVKTPKPREGRPTGSARVSVIDPMKIVQAAAIVIKAHGGRVGRKRLLKILYIADRERLGEVRRTITRDSALAMEIGPVLSKTYDLINDCDTDTPLWSKHIKRIGPRDIEILNEPGNGKLSKSEIEKLNEVCERCSPLEDDEVAAITHTFQEWKDNEPPPGKSNPISIDQRLKAVGLTAKDKAAIMSDHEEDVEIQKLLDWASRQ